MAPEYDVILQGHLPGIGGVYLMGKILREVHDEHFQKITDGNKPAPGRSIALYAPAPSAGIRTGG